MLIILIALRHNVNMSDDIFKYGWTTYDTREGGRQILEDVGNKMNITTDFIKPQDEEDDGNWGLRIRGVPRDDAPADLKTTVIFYVAMDAMEGCAECKLEAREQLGAGEDTSVHAVNLDIAHPKLGAAGMHISTPSSGSSQNGGTVVKTMNVSEEKLWQAKCEFNSHRSTLVLPGSLDPHDFGVGD